MFAFYLISVTHISYDVMINASATSAEGTTMYTGQG